MVLFIFIIYLNTERCRHGHEHLSHTHTHTHTPQEGDAMGYVAGYTVAHDVSARDWQMHKNGGQWLIGKTFDTFCPIGPAIVTVPSISGGCVLWACLM